MAHYATDEPNDSSEYLGDSDETPVAHFSEISIIHRSDRNLVLKAKRYGRWWILKCVNPDFNDAATAAALQKEFEVSLLIPSGAAVSVYSMEEVRDYGQCIVMDYVDGTSLLDWLKNPHSMAEREQLAIDIVKSVGMIHAAGVVHRDIKPSNIIVRSLGSKAVIIDFGLSDTASYTIFKQPAGTRSYLSPEQASASTPDIRNDIYSLGVILKEMQLPGYWRPAIRKCLLPIDSRMPDTTALLNTCSRYRRLYRLTAAAILSLIIIAGIVWATVALRPVPETGHVLTQKDPVPSASFDSLKTVTDSQLSSLNLSLKNITDSVEDARTAAEQRQKRMDQAIQREQAVLDKIFLRTGMAYLDTAGRSGFVAPMFDTAPLNNELERYLKENSGNFTEQELTLIRVALNKKIQNDIEKWIKRREKMLSKH